MGKNYFRSERISESEMDSSPSIEIELEEAIEEAVPEIKVEDAVLKVEAVTPSEDIAVVARKVIAGHFGQTPDEIKPAVEAAGYDYDEVQKVKLAILTGTYY